MGEAKRRQAALGNRYGKKPSPISKWKISSEQQKKILNWTKEGILLSIVLLAISWLVFYFSGQI